MAGHNIIVFSDDWGRHPFSCQHIMQHFLPNNKVLWVNTIGMRRPRLTMKDFKRSVQKLRSFAAKPIQERLPDNLTIINPPMFPFGNRLVRFLNRRSVISAVREKMQSLGMTAPIILTTLPNASEYLGSLGEMLAVYYCVDDFTLWPGVNEALVLEMERRLVRKVDLLVCSSGELAVIKSREGLQTEILPHGVDYTHFSRCAAGTQVAVAYLAALPRPIVGYFGLLGEWVDLSIIESLAADHPEWSLVLMGNVVTDTSRLTRFPNVHFTGPVPYAELPDHVAYVDALVLPYHVGGRGKTITPLKLREYIATGKPVVSTAIPECVLYRSHIFIAAAGAEFVACVEDALHDTAVKSADRQKMVQEESWQNRAETLSRYIEKLLLDKQKAQTQ